MEQKSKIVNKTTSEFAFKLVYRENVHTRAEITTFTHVHALPFAAILTYGFTHISNFVHYLKDNWIILHSSFSINPTISIEIYYRWYGTKEVYEA